MSKIDENIRKYFSNRNNKKRVSIQEVHIKLCNIFEILKEKDYFYQKLNISHSIPKNANRKATILLGFEIFPFDDWNKEKINENNIFDAIEFLFDNISKPGEEEQLTSETGIDYVDYKDYNVVSGRIEFRKYINIILEDYKDGYMLSEEGEILSTGSKEISLIFDAEQINYDYENIDLMVKKAIKKWRNRELNLDERKEAIILMTNVFEWLKKQDKLEKVLNKKDNSTIFNIANNFSLRHHNPNQIQDYDKDIWYSWIFHFYLATYHAVIRLIKKTEND